MSISSYDQYLAESERVTRHMDERNSAIYREIESMRQLREKSAKFKAKRAMIRSGRVLCGLMLAGLAMVIFENKRDVSHLPFSALTLDLLFSNIIHWLLGLGALYYAWRAAFGPKPTDEEVFDELRHEAERVVDEREQHAQAGQAGL